jgi:hypothetical protein
MRRIWFNDDSQLFKKYSNLYWDATEKQTVFGWSTCDMRELGLI